MCIRDSSVAAMTGRRGGLPLPVHRPVPETARSGQSRIRKRTPKDPAGQLRKVLQSWVLLFTPEELNMLLRGTKRFNIGNNQINFVARDLKWRVIWWDIRPQGISRDTRKYGMRSSRVKGQEAFAPIRAFNHPCKGGGVPYSSHAVVVSDHMTARAQLSRQLKTQIG